MPSAMTNVARRRDQDTPKNRLVERAHQRPFVTVLVHPAVLRSSSGDPEYRRHLQRDTRAVRDHLAFVEARRPREPIPAHVLAMRIRNPLTSCQQISGRGCRYHARQNLSLRYWQPELPELRISDLVVELIVELTRDVGRPVLLARHVALQGVERVARLVRPQLRSMRVQIQPASRSRSKSSPSVTDQVAWKLRGVNEHLGCDARRKPVRNFRRNLNRPTIRRFRRGHETSFHLRRGSRTIVERGLARHQVDEDLTNQSAPKGIYGIVERLPLRGDIVFAALGDPPLALLTNKHVDRVPPCTAWMRRSFGDDCSASDGMLGHSLSIAVQEHTFQASWDNQLFLERFKTRFRQSAVKIRSYAPESAHAHLALAFTPSQATAPARAPRRAPGWQVDPPCRAASLRRPGRG